MTRDQEAHLDRIKAYFDARIDRKYRKGARNHGGDLLKMTALELNEESIKENIDQFTYLQRQRELLLAPQVPVENPAGLFIVKRKKRVRSASA